MLMPTFDLKNRVVIPIHDVKVMHTDDSNKSVVIALRNVDLNMACSFDTDWCQHSIIKKGGCLDAKWSSPHSAVIVIQNSDLHRSVVFVM